MPDLRYKTCKGCGKSSAEAGDLSWTRLCYPCAKARVIENNDGISTHTGPAFTRWRRAMAASVGGVLVDDLRGET